MTEHFFRAKEREQGRRRAPVIFDRKITVPVPRCPLCGARMESCQFMWVPEDDNVPGLTAFLRSIGQKPRGRWHETWGCDSCHTTHTFPARLDMLQLAKGSAAMPSAHRSLFLPK